jgi:hypothetical protein
MVLPAAVGPISWPQKGEAFRNFKIFYKMVLTQFWKNQKWHPIDGCYEYGMNKLEEFCQEKGIFLEVTAPYTPD